MERLQPLLLESPEYGTIHTARDWTERRRPELLDVFAREVFGRAPAADRYELSVAHISQTLDGRWHRKRVTLALTAALGAYRFPLELYIPRGAVSPCPVVLHLRNRFGNDTDGYAEDLVAFDVLYEHGFAAALVRTGDLSPDRDGALAQGISGVFARSGAPWEWKTIAAWAFGLSRCMDYLTGDDGVDGGRVALVGHSRAGKTVLWAAANDPRFAMVFANESGCSGAACERGKRGERIADINRVFPHWFCENYRGYDGRPDAMPFDFHMLLAAITPRPLYLAGAVQDSWADPAAEYRALKAAQEAYALFGCEAPLPDVALPPAGTAYDCGHIGYHLRAGAHGLLAQDWRLFMSFAARRFL